jgi:hypothetical protein
MVDYVADSGELARRVRLFAFGGAAEAADAELADKLQRIPGVEADLLTQSAELLYAYRDRLDEAGLTLLAEVWTYANEQGWATLAGGRKGTDNRAERIVRDVRRDLGELRSEVDPEAAPEPVAALRGGFDWRRPDEDPPAPVTPLVAPELSE